MRAKVTTLIDGNKLSIVGNLSANNKKITDKRGMVLYLSDTDKIEFITHRKRDKLNIIACPFDMHKWFKASKQL